MSTEALRAALEAEEPVDIAGWRDMIQAELDDAASWPDDGLLRSYYEAVVAVMTDWLNKVDRPGRVHRSLIAVAATWGDEHTRRFVRGRTPPLRLMQAFRMELETARAAVEWWSDEHARSLAALD